jgi:hypothetical protein
MKRFCSILLLTLPALGADLNITLAHNSKPETATRDQLVRVLGQYDVADFTWTKQIVVDATATPHSHPVLTLNTKYQKQDKQLLATFVHEQYHWYEEKHKSDTDAAIAELRRKWLTLPVGAPEGADDEDSSYLHVIVCYAEFQELKRLLGEGDAKKIMDFWANDHYKAIYKLVISEEVAVGAIVKRHGLWPPQ